MRTLSRPMFNMGGPIKQGIMHGIREPYRGGGAALVGNPVYPQTGGREHHNVWLTAGNVAGRGIRAFKNIFGKTGPVTRTVPKQGPTYYPPTGRTLSSKGYPGGKITGTPQGPGSTEIIEQQFKPNWLGKYLGSSPEVGIAKKLYEGKGFITKPIKALAKSPIVAGTLIWQGGKWLRSDGSPASDLEIKQNKDQHGPFDHTEKKTTKQAQADFAKTQRDTRVQRYLDLMGYDRAKKTAIADALIDASKIVSDRGTLDRKNITGELINPAIQALSKRLDKPDQIREAVGLMMVKGEIEKDLEDPSIKALRLEQLKELRGGLADDVGDFILSAKGAKVKPQALESYVRSRANKYGLDFTVVTDEQLAQIPEGASEEEIMSTLTSGDGVYKIKDSIIQVTDGVPKRIA